MGPREKDIGSGCCLTSMLSHDNHKSVKDVYDFMCDPLYKGGQ